MDIALVVLILVVILLLVGAFFLIPRFTAKRPGEPVRRERAAADHTDKQPLEQKPAAPITRPVQKPGAAPEEAEEELGGALMPEENEPQPILDDAILLDRSMPAITEQAKQEAPETPPPPSAAETFGGQPSKTLTGESAVDTIQVSAYYPKEIKPADWQPIHAYMFRGYAAGAVVEDASKQLGARQSQFRTVGRTASLPVQEGALVVAAPTLPGFEFNPPTAQIRFYKDWHRFDFELRVKDAPLNQAANGFITFTVEGIIVADVPISIYVGETTTAQPEMTSASLYQAIFCSYSHQDTAVVQRAERAYKALGLDYLRDVISLRSGEEWSEELLNLINGADVFQLFWSDAAAHSQHVRFEWEHALKLAAQRQRFIRPVYWESPTPPIPPELNHIHFAYQPDLLD